MEIINEIADFVIAFGVINIAVMFAGLFYGINRKAGITIIVAGSAALFSFVVWGLSTYGFENYTFSFGGSFFAGVLSGLLSPFMFDCGKGYGEKVLAAWRIKQ